MQKSGDPGFSTVHRRSRASRDPHRWAEDKYLSRVGRSGRLDMRVHLAQTIAVGFGLIGVAQALRLLLLIFAATFFPH